MHKFITRCIQEYDPSHDDWAGGQEQELLDIEKDAQGKVKIKTTVMPKGSLDKLKKDASRLKESDQPDIAKEEKSDL